MGAEIDFEPVLAVGGRKRAEQSVRIAHSDDSDARGASQRPRGAVAHGLACGRLADLKDAAFEVHHGAEGVRPAPLRVSAIKRNAGAHQVVDEAGPKQNARRIGEAGRRLGQLGAQSVEQPPLRVVLAMARVVGAGEMAHHQSEREGRPHIGGLLHGVDLRHREAEPVHAAVDMDGAGKLLADARAIIGPFPDFFGAIQDGPQIEELESLRGAGQVAAEHVDDGLGQKCPQALRLGDGRHEEGPAARAPKRGRCLCHAEAVGVGLDHGGALGRRGQRAQAPVIGGERVEVDGEDGGRVRIRLGVAWRRVARARVVHSRRSGKRSDAARFENRVNSGVN